MGKELQHVVIADDHPPTRFAVRSALEADGFVVDGEAYDARSALDLVEATSPDVALLDVRMPGGGIAAAASILATRPETAIVMLTVSEDEEDLFAALRVGALGYVLKGGDPARIPETLRAVIAGEAGIDGALMTTVIREFQTRERRRLFAGSPRVRLTRREREVLVLLDEGATTAEIADRLFVAKVTVRSHIAAIHRKLRLPDREALLNEFGATSTVEQGDENA
jgi:DNA-binding NarL/FixJ family response regulator